MKANENLVPVYSGTEASALLLKGRLERLGIASEIRKESTSGTWGIVPDNIELYIEESLQGEAEPVIREFLDKKSF
ncbi:MAG TPA: hypothetical protein VK213_07810 [Bacteroidales bacterium]|nr:hypothetical protein [Bacteroidales bacterium]